MKIMATVCNVCEQLGVPTHEYGIRLGSKEVLVDLCDLDSRQLDEWLGKEEATAPTQAPRAPRTGTKKAAGSNSSPAPSRRRRGAQIVSLDDIERSKKQ